MKYANTKVASKKQEKRIAKEMNAKVTIASGALDFQKADVRNEQYLVEAKTTEKPYYPLNITTWKKIEQQALKDGLRTPVMCVDINDGKSSLAILNVHDFEALKEENVGKYNIIKVIPSLFAKKSTRITESIMSITYVGSNNLPTINYQMISFEDKTDLIMLDWNDFILMLGEN